MWQLLLAFAALVGLLRLGPWLNQYFEDRRARHAFRSKQCPKCGQLYTDKDLRRAKHLVKTRTIGGPLPVPLEGHFFEVREFSCSACGHVQDWSPKAEPIDINTIMQTGFEERNELESD